MEENTYVHNECNIGKTYYKNFKKFEEQLYFYKQLLILLSKCC